MELWMIRVVRKEEEVIGTGKGESEIEQLVQQV